MLGFLMLLCLFIYLFVFFLTVVHSHIFLVWKYIYLETEVFWEDRNEERDKDGDGDGDGMGIRMGWGCGWRHSSNTIFSCNNYLIIIPCFSFLFSHYCGVVVLYLQYWSYSTRPWLCILIIITQRSCKSLYLYNYYNQWTLALIYHQWTLALIYHLQ